jgi:mono/diheme cytochrome c family protein
MKPSRALLPLIICLVAQAGSAGAQPKDQLRRGHALLQEFCGRCHAVARTDIKRNAPPFRTLGREFDLDQFERRLERGISSTHPDMPEVKFSEDDAHAAAAYLRSIQK